MGTFYGREGKPGRSCGRGCACTENYGGSDVYGRFDYASLKTNEMENSKRLAILVLSDTLGAVVREVPPPKR